MPSNKLDLNELVNKPDHQLTVTLSSDDPAERESRIRIKEADAKHLRIKELIVYSLTSVVILSVVSLCIWIVAKKGLSTDEGKLALGLLTSIVTGLVGYVTGRSSK